MVVDIDSCEVFKFETHDVENFIELKVYRLVSVRNMRNRLIAPNISCISI